MFKSTRADNSNFSLSCTYVLALQSCLVESEAHAAQLNLDSNFKTSGSSKPNPTFSAYSCRNSTSSVSCFAYLIAPWVQIRHVIGGTVSLQAWNPISRSLEWRCSPYLNRHLLDRLLPLLPDFPSFYCPR